MSTLFQASADTPVKPPRNTTADMVEECLVRTAEALQQTGAANDTHIHQALAKARESIEKGQPVDLIETLARTQGQEEEFISPIINQLGELVASTMASNPPHIPFAAKLIAPSGFYESFDAIHKLGRLLLTPVIFAEDTDAIGIASINPIAADILSEEILSAVAKRVGIRPFMSVVRLDYES